MDFILHSVTGYSTFLLECNGPNENVKCYKRYSARNKYNPVSALHGKPFELANPNIRILLESTGSV